MPADLRPLLASLLACPLLSPELRSEQIPLTAEVAEQNRTLLHLSSKVKYSGRLRKGWCYRGINDQATLPGGPGIAEACLRPLP